MVLLSEASSSHLFMCGWVHVFMLVFVCTHACAEPKHRIVCLLLFNSFSKRLILFIQSQNDSLPDSVIQCLLSSPSTFPASKSDEPMHLILIQVILLNSVTLVQI